MTRQALYPGTFDPVTFGHIDLIRRAARVFDRVFVAVAHNSAKQPLLSVAERTKMLTQATRRLGNVTVDSFDGLMVDYARQKHITMVLRGLRMVSDFEAEFQMALTNRRLNSKIELIYMMPQEQYSFISSSLIKELAVLGADLSAFVPRYVEKRIKQVLAQKAGSSSYAARG